MKSYINFVDLAIHQSNYDHASLSTKASGGMEMTRFFWATSIQGDSVAKLHGTTSVEKFFFLEWWKK